MINHTKRDYRMSEGDLIQDADFFVSIVTDDLPDLAAYGIDAITLQDLKDRRRALDETTTDREMLGYVVLATGAKDAFELRVQEAIRQIVGRVVIKYGENSLNHRQFIIPMLSKEVGSDLYQDGKLIWKLATAQLADLASAGLTQMMLDDFADLIKALDDKITDQRVAINNRDHAVEVRIRVGNYLYELMKRISKAGHLCYDNVSATKSDAYNLTHVHPHPTIQIIEGNVAATQATSTTLLDAEATTSLEIFNTGTGSLTFFFAENITDITGPTVVVAAAGESLTIIASSLGFVEGTRERLNVFNPGPDDGSYRIEWV